MHNQQAFAAYRDDMRIAKYSEITITDRIELLTRLAQHIDGTPLLAAGPEELRSFQRTYLHLAPASVNLYSRHIKAFYAWAVKRHHLDVDPAADLIVARAPKGRPHPTSPDDLRLIFSCVRGPLRIAYVLAAFAGLRCGEITRLHRPDLDLDGMPTALVHGKGRKERIVPLLPPVMNELYRWGLPARGAVVVRNGRPFTPEKLSAASYHYLRGLGVATTLHSMRGSFATNLGRITRDPMFVRDCLGHETVATSEVYMLTSMQDAHVRMAGMSTFAEGLLGPGGVERGAACAS